MLNPLRLVVWAGLEGLITHRQMSGLLEIGRVIARSLEGDTLEEKLASFERGAENRDEFRVEGVKGKLVGLKQDIFGEFECCSLPWSQRTTDLLHRYNTVIPKGGGAAHPLIIVLHEVHRRLGDVVDIGSRNINSGEVAISKYGLQRTGLTESQAMELLSDYAVVYCLCGEK